MAHTYRNKSWIYTTEFPKEFCRNPNGEAFCVLCCRNVNYDKRFRVQRRQLRWQRDVPMTICMLDWKQKKVKKSCTDWLGRETEQGKMYST